VQIISRKVDMNLTVELSYLLGVYMSDGTICKRKKKNRRAWVYDFGFSSIDKDFAEEVQSTFEKVLKKRCRIRKYQSTRRRRKVAYIIGVWSKDLLKWMREITKVKEQIPPIIWNASVEKKKAFLRGYMDGDGWIAESKRYDRNTNKLRYEIGFGGTKEWVDDLKKLFQQIGVVVGKRQLITKGKWIHRPLIRYHIKPISFVRAGMYFTAKRKQDRVIRYIQQVHIELLRDYTLTLSNERKI